jgi:hypothetical protein
MGIGILPAATELPGRNGGPARNFVAPDVDARDSATTWPADGP